MSPAALPWALLVACDPAPTSVGARRSSVIDPPATVLDRALSLTSIAKTCCLIGEALRPQWFSVIERLWPANVQSMLPDEQVVEGVIGCLSAISTQEPEATVILIPFNHCAVEELTWLSSAEGALRLGSANRNTVYLLHDNPDNDPRISVKKPGVCSSSVLVGSVAPLLALCIGKRETVVLDLVVERPDADDLATSTDSPGAPPNPINVVHVRLAEEYTRLQQTDVWHRRVRAIDVHA